MSASCNACYEASTSPLWVAQFVTRLRVDQPCKHHCPAAEVRSTDTTKDPRERAEYLAASNADAAMGDWRPANETGEDG